MSNMNQWDTSDLPLKVEKPSHWRKGIETCNITACQTGRNVMMWNYSTKVYYCVKCTRMINVGCRVRDRLLCSIDKGKMDYEKDKDIKLVMSWTRL